MTSTTEARAAFPTGIPGRISALLERFAPQDWLVLGYLVCVNVGVLQGVPGATRDAGILKIVGLFLWVAIAVSVVRAEWIRPHWLNALVYRCTLYFPVQLSYFFFRDLLPVINPGSFDTELHSLDLWLFGIEPAVALDRFVTPVTTEWFAFFYFGYFFVLALHVIPILFFGENQRVLGEFALGTLAVVCFGQTIYMLVPGWGPYRAMADSFQHEFPPGPWIEAVRGAVASGGALKDIFPSLHTALPAFIALFSFRNRALPPFRYTWPIVLFSSVNIIGATLFLRWHYLIDVAAGLLLASLSAWLAPLLIERDLERRHRRGLDALWPEYSAGRGGRA
jgi:hypothetical protein